MLYSKTFEEVTDAVVAIVDEDVVVAGHFLPTDMATTNNQICDILADHVHCKVELPRFVPPVGALAERYGYAPGMEGDWAVAELVEKALRLNPTDAIPGAETQRLLGSIFTVPVEQVYTFLEGKALVPKRYQGIQAWSVDFSTYGPDHKAFKTFRKMVNAAQQLEGGSCLHVDEDKCFVYAARWVGANPADVGLNGEKPLAPPLTHAFGCRTLTNDLLERFNERGFVVETKEDKLDSLAAPKDADSDSSDDFDFGSLKIGYTAQPAPAPIARETYLVSTQQAAGSWKAPTGAVRARGARGGTSTRHHQPHLPFDRNQRAGPYPAQTLSRGGGMPSRRGGPARPASSTSSLVSLPAMAAVSPEERATEIIELIRSGQYSWDDWLSLKAEPVMSVVFDHANKKVANSAKLQLDRWAGSGVDSDAYIDRLSGEMDRMSLPEQCLLVHRIASTGVFKKHANGFTIGAFAI